MLSNEWAKNINHTLAIIKLATYSTIAIAGLYRLIVDPDSRLNWQKSLSGNTDIAILMTLVKTFT